MAIVKKLPSHAYISDCTSVARLFTIYNDRVGFFKRIFFNVYVHDPRRTFSSVLFCEYGDAGSDKPFQSRKNRWKILLLMCNYSLHYSRFHFSSHSVSSVTSHYLHKCPTLSFHEERERGIERYRQIKL